MQYADLQSAVHNRLVEANNFSPLEFHRVEGKYLSGLNAVVFPIKVM